MEVRPVAAKLPEMFIRRNGMFGLWQVVCVESRGCEPGQDDGEGV